MKITIKFLEGIRDFTKEKQLDLNLDGKEFIIMAELIDILLDKYGDNLSKVFFAKNSEEKLIQFKNGIKNIEFDLIKFLINGEMFSYIYDKKIYDNDVIVLFLPLGGG